MPYELRRPGQPPLRFETEQEAEAEARQMILADPDARIDVVDLATGRPATPAGSQAERDELAKRIGF